MLSLGTPQPWALAIASGLGLSIGWFGVLATLGGGLLIALLFLLLVVFPSGRFPSGRWGRFALVGLGVFAVIEGLILVSPTVAVYVAATGSPEIVANPIGLLPDVPVVAVIQSTLAPLFVLVMFLAGAAFMIDRLRAADGIERQQRKWVVASAALLVAAVAFGIATVLVLGDLAWIPASLALPLPPLAVGVAVLRYRLYEIDRIVNRAIVYGSLTAILAGLFAAGATLAQRLFVAITGESSDAALVVTTLFVATVYTPLRKRLEAAVDRHFKYDHRRFGEYRDDVARLLSLSEPRRVAERLVKEAVDELQATGGAVVDASGRPTATAGEWPVAPVLRVAIPGGHGPLEALLVGPRRDREPHDPRTIAELEELAREVLLAVSHRIQGPG
jgi:hypothetical protein